MRALIAAFTLSAFSAFAVDTGLPDDAPRAPKIDGFVPADAPPLRVKAGSIIVQEGLIFAMPSGVYVPDAEWVKLTAPPGDSKVIPIVAVAAALVLGIAAGATTVVLLKK